MLNKKIVYLIFSLLNIVMLSCRKWANVEAPYTQITASDAFANDDNALAAINAIYTNMVNENRFSGSGSIGFLAALGADETTLNNVVSDPQHQAYYENNLQSNKISYLSYGTEFWSPLYNYIYLSNNIIEQLPRSEKISVGVKRQILGEAKFLRAFFYFYLVNLYGDVPLAKSTDYTVNRMLPRSKISDVYDFIVADLKFADSSLSQDYLDGSLIKYPDINTAERVRPTTWAAKALLARVYLYKKDYAKSEDLASQVISNNTFYNLTALENVFLKNSGEAIWQLQTLNPYQNTDDAIAYVLSSYGPGYSQPAYLSDFLLNSFQPGDRRNIVWVDSVNTTTGNTYHFPNKYKNTSPSILEYTMVFRLAEQYLIRAEVRAMQGKIAEAVADLNMIRTRARATPSASIPNPLPDLSASLNQQQVMNAVMQERRVELFTEWGHRWLDLKRTDSINSVMNIVTPIKANGQPWRPYQALYPILFADLQNDPNLIQNSGY